MGEDVILDKSWGSSPGNVFYRCAVKHNLNISSKINEQLTVQLSEILIPRQDTTQNKALSLCPAITALYLPRYNFDTNPAIVYTNPTRVMKSLKMMRVENSIPGFRRNVKQKVSWTLYSRITTWSNVAILLYFHDNFINLWNNFIMFHIHLIGCIIS